jgi:hypothetical protein
MRTYTDAIVSGLVAKVVGGLYKSAAKLPILRYMSSSHNILDHKV